jgi:hypothetical protein
MDAKLFVAEHVSHHPDGTFTAVRAGIDQFRGEPGEPIPLEGHLMIMIDASRHEVGEHDFSISFVNMRGKKVADDIEGSFGIPEGGGNAQFSVGFQLQVPEPATYEFGLTIEGQQVARWTVHASTEDEEE